VNQPENIIVGIDSCPGYEPGCYIQGLGRIIIGDYTAIAMNVGIIGANHVSENLQKHDKTETTRIGNYCWIGMNAVILPNVELGDFTVVGAGSVVTKSFSEGYCIIAGNPAKKIRDLDRSKCVRFESKNQYVGYIKKQEFDNFRKRRLWF
jgi:acetyltransferase-like isoleucine patch superfamily enzyme